MYLYRLFYRWTNRINKHIITNISLHLCLNFHGSFILHYTKLLYTLPSDPFTFRKPFHHLSELFTLKDNAVIITWQVK